MSHATTALELFDQADGPDDERALLLVELAEAKARVADPNTERTFHLAISTARHEQTGIAFARAVLGLSDPWTLSGQIATDRIALLHEALDLLGDDAALRARLQGRLAAELYYVDGSGPRRRQLSDSAVELARFVGDPHALVAALEARTYATWGLGGVDDRNAGARQILAVAEQMRAPELTLSGLGWLITASIELGDVATARHAVSRYQQLADQLRQPRHVWYALTRAAMLQALSGDHQRALRTAEAARAVGQDQPDADNVHHALLAPITILTGSAADLPTFVAHADNTARLVGPDSPSTCYVTAVAAAAAAQWGITATAHAMLGRLPAGWADSDDLVSAGTLAAAAWAASITHDRRIADTIAERLASRRGTHLVVAGAVAYWGAAAHWLGLLADVRGDRTAANELFQQALDEHRRVNATAFEGLTLHALDRG